MVTKQQTWQPNKCNTIATSNKHGHQNTINKMQHTSNKQQTCPPNKNNMQHKSTTKKRNMATRKMQPNSNKHGHQTKRTCNTKATQKQETWQPLAAGAGLEVCCWWLRRATRGPSRRSRRAGGGVGEMAGPTHQKIPGVEVGSLNRLAF